MTYGLDFRYRRALDPQGLSILQTATDAVIDAIKDARNVGLDPEQDPAVTLLARHLRRLATCKNPDRPHPEDTALRAQCLERIAGLKARPAIIALVRRGVDHDPEAKRAFRREASRALRQIAREIGLTPDQFGVQCYPDHRGPAGDVSLASEQLHLRITADAFRNGREVTYRRSRDRHDEFGGPIHYADISRLADIPKFALRIAGDFGLAALCSQDRPFAGD